MVDQSNWIVLSGIVCFVIYRLCLKDQNPRSWNGVFIPFYLKPIESRRIKEKKVLQSIRRDFWKSCIFRRLKKWSTRWFPIFSSYEESNRLSHDAKCRMCTYVRSQVWLPKPTKEKIEINIIIPRIQKWYFREGHKSSLYLCTFVKVSPGQYLY